MNCEDNPSSESESEETESENRIGSIIGLSTAHYYWQGMGSGCLGMIVSFFIAMLFASGVKNDQSAIGLLIALTIYLSPLIAYGLWKQSKYHQKFAGPFARGAIIINLAWIIFLSVLESVGD